MFKLEAAIAGWRKQMLAAGVKTPAPLEELEIHLREEIERLINTGLNEEEAFHSAIQTIGPAPALSNEFKKVEAGLKAWQWNAWGVLFLVATLSLPLLVGSMAFLFKNGTFSDMTAIQQVSSLTAAAAFALLAWGMRWSCGRFPVFRTNRVRDALFVPVVLWAAALAYIVIPRCELTVSQSGVVSLWGFAPFGIMIGWLWGMTAAEGKKAAAA